MEREVLGEARRRARNPLTRLLFVFMIVVVM